jgi:uncharacterized protein
MPSTQRPRFRDLEPHECEALLSRNHVGRLAFAQGNRVDIEPLHYVHHAGWLYGRTSHGAKLEVTGYEWWPVAFEVDEVEDVFRWRSVVVHGGFYVLDEHGPEWERSEWRRGVELLRELVPDTFAEGDPVPHRRVLFRISVQEINGRESIPASDAR